MYKDTQPFDIGFWQGVAMVMILLILILIMYPIFAVIAIVSSITYRVGKFIRTQVYKGTLK